MNTDDILIQRLEQFVGAGDAKEFRLSLLVRYRDYGRQTRAYHNIEHALRVAEVLDLIHPGGKAGATEVAAALYHDAICTPGEGVRNEAQSMSYFCTKMRERDVPLSPGFLAEVCDLIWATGLSGVGLLDSLTESQKRFLDEDHYGLGETWDVYEANRAAIRKEFISLADEVWVLGRTKFLEGMLDRDAIFLSQWEGKAAHEAQARNNIERELTSLGKV